MHPVNHQGVRIGELLPKTAMPADMQNILIYGLTLDSREVREGYAFIAKSGLKRHGLAFAEEAIKKGAVAILAEDQSATADWIEYSGKFVAVIRSASIGLEISEIAGRFFGEPSLKMTVFGITGTNGKSTTASLISQLNESLGYKAASIGTLGVIVADQEIVDTGMTTPDAVAAQKWLAYLCEQNVSKVAMEVSSHALDQYRVEGIRFQTAVFTNLSRDHLDYHQTMQSYAEAKQALFARSDLARVVVNSDDEYADKMLAVVPASVEVVRYALRSDAEFQATDLRYHSKGVTFGLRSPWGTAQIESPLLCEFNVYNLLAAIASVCLTADDFSRAVRSVPSLHPVAGRMQTAADPNESLTVVVDYAHTPDALQQAISGVRKHVSGKLHVIFGCGGDRDPGKRPLMGKIAQEFGDRVAITTDNPRTEDPLKIIREICDGMSGEHIETFLDRRQAITKVIRKAEAGDVILIAGKGHEKYQIIGEERLPFDDCAVALQALRERLNVGEGA